MSQDVARLRASSGDDVKTLKGSRGLGGKRASQHLAVPVVPFSMALSILPESQANQHAEREMTRGTLAVRISARVIFCGRVTADTRLLKRGLGRK